MPHDWKDGPGSEPIPGYRLVAALSGNWSYGEWSADGPHGRVRLGLADLGNEVQKRKACRAVALALNLVHPNLATPTAAKLIDGSGRTADVRTDPPFVPPMRLALVRELAGGTFEDRLNALNPDGTPVAARRGVPLGELLPAVRDAAAALDFLANPDRGCGPAAAVVHCDLRPANLERAGDRVRVAEYWGGHTQGGPTERQVGRIPAYSASEILANKPVPESDQYALAITYFELRTGCLPFPVGASLVEVFTAHTKGELDFRAPGLTAAERAVLRRATAVAPADRFPTCRDFAAAVEAATDAGA